MHAIFYGLVVLNMRYYIAKEWYSRVSGITKFGLVLSSLDDISALLTLVFCCCLCHQQHNLQLKYLGHQGNNHTYCLIKHQYYWKGMNKDIRKYIANCIFWRQDKAKVLQYPLQMTEIPDRPFDKITFDLVTDCETCTSGNKHILTIIDHLTGWLEAFPIPNKSADTIVATLINHYLPVHMCLRYMLLDNSTEFKNNLMDQVLQQLQIDRIFSAPYHPQNNGKLGVFHKYLKPMLKKLCEKDQANWDKYINQVLTSYRITPNLAAAELPFFLVYSRDPNLPLHQLLEPMQCLLGDPDSGKLHLETHRLALAIAKKTLDENRFTAIQKTLSRDNPSFQVGDYVYFKNKQPGKWDLKWRPRYRIVCIECNGHFIHIENQATGKTQSCNVTDIILEPFVEFWNVDTQFSRASCYINHSANLPTIQLADTS